MNNISHKRILLSVMPFWSLLNPPLGISGLKSHLQASGFNVEIYDFNAELELRAMMEPYFGILDKLVPEHKRGNFHMIGFDVFSNHLIAYLHQDIEPDRYRELIKILVEKNYFVKIGEDTAGELDKVVANFYHALRESVVRILSSKKPGIFGISVFSPTLGPSLFAFKMAKEMYPGIKTVMGGGVFSDHLALDSPNLHQFLQRTESYIDTVIAGEGEILFRKFLSGELGEDKRFYSLKDIGSETLDLKQGEIPDFSGLNLTSYSQMATYATRSCPFQCSFCSETVQWGKYRKKPVEQVESELTAIKERYGGKLFMFGDSLMNPVVTPLAERFLKNGMDIYWDGYLRADPDVLIPESASLWRRSGFYRARLGIESGSPHVLSLMNKKITPEQIKKALANLSDHGIKTTTYWVIGHPGETEKDFTETLDLLVELKDYIYEADWHPFYFYPKGQVDSMDWTENYSIEPLYPEEYTDMLLTQTWYIKTDPQREEIYDRLSRFADVCKELDIPNRYSLMNIYQSDKRWRDLHPKSGPTILELHNYNYLKK